jgi:hypothetical protein
MKFCKVLQAQAAEMPMMSDLFLRYKELKKKLKAFPKGELPAPARPTQREPSPARPLTLQGGHAAGAGAGGARPSGAGSDSDDPDHAGEAPAQQQGGPEQQQQGGPEQQQQQQQQQQLCAEELAFVATLNEDLHRFNAYYIDKEEDAVIRLQVGELLQLGEAVAQQPAWHPGPRPERYRPPAAAPLGWGTIAATLPLMLPLPRRR